MLRSGGWESRDGSGVFTVAILSYTVFYLPLWTKICV